MVLLDQVEYEQPYHVLGFSWSGEGPVLTLLPMRSEGPRLVRGSDPFDMDLAGMKEVGLRVSSSPFCVGRFDNGVHIPCPDTMKVSIFAQCPSCMSFDIPDPSCVFEPHCNRGSCGADFCQIEHVVYLTGFREKTKVGMTQLRRFEKRGREQGADVILPLLVLGDRYSARVMEWKISKFMGLPQSVPSNTKISGWGRSRDDSKISKRLMDLKIWISSKWEDLTDRLGPEVKITSLPIEFEQDPVPLKYPLEEPLPSSPRRYHNEIVRGDVLGFKGNYLLFRSSGLWAWRIGETPGRVMYFTDKV